MKDGNRKRAAEWILTAAVLAALAFAAGTAGIAQAALAREEAVTVALEGVCAGEEGYFQDTADAVITVHDRNFDRNSFAVTLRDGTDWEAEIGFTEEEGWTGASELPEKEIELTGWRRTRTGAVLSGSGSPGKETMRCRISAAAIWRGTGWSLRREEGWSSTAPHLFLRSACRKRNRGRGTDITAVR